MQTSDDADVRLSDYSGFLRRQWPVLVMGVGTGLILSVLAITFAPPTYESTTAVLVRPTSQDTNVSGGRTDTEINLDTEAQIVASSVVARLANANLSNGDLRSGLSDRELAARVSVTVPANTSVLNITFAAGTARGAMAGATAFAEAYLGNRTSLAEERITSRIETLQDSIASDNDRLRALDEQIANGGANLGTERELLVQQIRSNSLTLSPLLTETVQPGEIITEAPLPQQASGLSAPLLITSGVLAGVALGCLGALVRDQRDTRLRTRRDLERLGVDVLVAPFELPPPSLVQGQRSVNDEQVRRLRNALLARLDQHRGCFLVASTSSSVAGAVTAASLAVTLARSGVHTAYVCCNTVTDITADAFGEHVGSTLADVLRGSSSVESALYPVRGLRSLAVMPPGKEGSLFSELLQSPALRPALDELERRFDVVVLDVAPTSVNADAQTLAIATQGVMLVSELLRTTAGDVTEALDQMKHVRAPLLGGILVRMPDDAEIKHARIAQDQKDPSQRSHRRRRGSTVGRRGGDGARGWRHRTRSGTGDRSGRD